MCKQWSTELGVLGSYKIHVTHLLRLVSRDVQEDDGVRGRQASVALLAPLKLHAGLGGREGHAAEGIPVR